MTAVMNKAIPASRTSSLRPILPAPESCESPPPTVWPVADEEDSESVSEATLDVLDDGV